MSETPTPTPAHRKVNVGVVGSTGVVGETFLNLMEERDFAVGELRLFASESSVGARRRYHDIDLSVQALSEGCFDGLHLVFFSSGDDVSQIWAPRAVAAGAFAVDNSGAFRLHPDVKLIVPEVNGDLLPKAGARPEIIANPNCSTIQLAVVLEPLRKAFGLKGVRVATYQSVSGAGRAGLEELFTHTKLALEGEEMKASAAFPKSMAFDCVPQIGPIGEDGYCSEETKIMNETRKILRRDQLPVSAFTVRVPTLNAHAEAVWVTLEANVPRVSDVEAVLSTAPGVELHDGGHRPAEGPPYPTQAMASGRDAVFVGRVHRDAQDPMTWLMWIVSDNLRKGAALNGIQIAERIFDLR